MSLSKTTLSAIQQAGQALHQATVVVSGAVREQAEHLVTTVASQPFQAEGDQAFANFKSLARLSQDLLTLEEQLRGLYATAAELSSPEMDVVAALPRVSALNHVAVGAQTAEDAIVKPAKVRRTRKAAKVAKATKTKGNKKTGVAALSGNDNKVLQFLQTALNNSAWKTLTGLAIAQGSGLPLGSVGISLKRVIASGAVQKNGRSDYKLSA
jgi:hypothetical protein